MQRLAQPFNGWAIAELHDAHDGEAKESDTSGDVDSRSQLVTSASVEHVEYNRGQKRQIDEPW